MEPFRDSTSAFKLSHIYPSIGATMPSELWLFLASLNDAAFGFSSWKTAPHVRRCVCVTAYAYVSMSWRGLGVGTSLLFFSIIVDSD